MNYSTDQVIDGIINYADGEIINKLPTSGKWIVGTSIGLLSSKATNVIEALRDNAIINMLGMVDDDGNIDIDTLISAMKSASEKYGKLSVEIPLIGKMTFSSDDVETLKKYIS